MGIQQMLLAAGNGFLLDFQDMIASDGALSPADAEANIIVNSAGLVTTIVSGDDFQLILQGDPADLEIEITGSGDALDLDSDPTATWLPMGVTYQWNLTQTNTGVKQFDGDYSVRIAATGQVLGGGVFRITSTVNI
jgi:hypothetical protein